MEEKVFMSMYEQLFANFQEQTRVFMQAVVEKQNNNESISFDILEGFKKNLIDSLNILGSSIENINNEEFKNFYKAKIDYNYQYIEELSNIYKSLMPSQK